MNIGSIFKINARLKYLYSMKPVFSRWRLIYTLSAYWMTSDDESLTHMLPYYMFSLPHHWRYQLYEDAIQRHIPQCIHLRTALTYRAYARAVLLTWGNVRFASTPLFAWRYCIVWYESFSIIVHYITVSTKYRERERERETKRKRKEIWEENTYLNINHFFLLYFEFTFINLYNVTKCTIEKICYIRE